MPQFAPPLLDINQAGSQGRGKGRPGSRFSMLKPRLQPKNWFPQIYLYTYYQRKFSGKLPIYELLGSLTGVVVLAVVVVAVVVLVVVVLVVVVLVVVVLIVVVLVVVVQVIVAVAVVVLVVVLVVVVLVVVVVVVRSSSST